MSDIDNDKQVSRKPLLGNRNFRMLFIGSTISNFGDQFHIVALPCLILLITGDNALALGSIMAAAGIPRAIIMVLVALLAYSSRSLRLLDVIEKEVV